MRRLLCLLLVWAASGSIVIVEGQESPPSWIRDGITVGSEAERYLRVLQLAGEAPSYPWTVRGFAPAELAVFQGSSGHPWQTQIDFNPELVGDLEWGWTQPRIGLLSNSTYPFGENDGAIWAGKGLTAHVEVGAFFRFGPLNLRFAPEGFWSENTFFPLANNGRSGSAVYRDKKTPDSIDNPQRFGDESYARIGWGSSVLHLTLPGITMGISGAGQQWGPALHYPLLLGNNSGGFPHVFVQTATPINLWLMRVHGRYIFGRPSQSDFSPAAEEEGQRLAAGAVLSITPRGFDGLELGVARFLHSLLSSDSRITRQDLFRVFSGVTQDAGNAVSRNQLASLFFRWVFSGAGVEVYGELVKEDFVRDLRHAIEEPDDFMGRVFGFQKLWSLSDGRFAVLRGEAVSAQVHHSERFGRLRLWNADQIAAGGRPLPLYFHVSGAGHTHLGQLLGSPTAHGGSGWTLGLDFYDKEGRWSADLSRAVQTEFSAIHGGTNGPGISDVIYALELGLIRFHNSAEWGATLTPSVNLNRNLSAENDVFNLAIGLSIRGFPW